MSMQPSAWCRVSSYKARQLMQIEPFLPFSFPQACRASSREALCQADVVGEAVTRVAARQCMPVCLGRCAMRCPLLAALLLRTLSSLRHADLTKTSVWAATAWWSHWTGATCNRALELQACLSLLSGRGVTTNGLDGLYGFVQLRSILLGVAWLCGLRPVHRFLARCANQDIPGLSYCDNSLPCSDNILKLFQAVVRDCARFRPGG
ncbi:hypothetical protein GE09DRAFT_13947 [Coniochaeta sp. 2T2.1]|nr:hypothetical protein GE09DRAFT_13947 [Coniochaeta sp. 2T2.1]